MDDKWSLWDAAGRHGQLALQGLRVASHVLRQGADAATLAEALGQLRGPVIKIAQFLATLPGFLPTDYADALAQLQSHAPPMNALFVKRRMATELGANWQQKLATFNVQPSFAASLGQVHQATLHDGRLVACKLQYPRMDHVIENDLQQLQWWLKVYNAMDGTIDHTDILQEIHTHLMQELDYSQEQQHMQNFARHYSHLMTIPSVITDLSTSKLLSMTWHEGAAVWNAPPELVAEQLFRAWYTPFYERGWLHSDPHPGNYRFDAQTEKLIVYDFGCVRHFDTTFVQGVKDLYQALQSHKSPVPALEAWGFKNLTPDLVEALTLWAHLLFEPFLDDRKRLLYDNPEEVQKRAENVYKVLKAAGGVRPPREFVLMDRTALGLGGGLTRLKAPLNWCQLLCSIMDGTSK